MVVVSPRRVTPLLEEYYPVLRQTLQNLLPLGSMQEKMKVLQELGIHQVIKVGSNNVITLASSGFSQCYGEHHKNFLTLILYVLTILEFLSKLVITRFLSRIRRWHHSIDTTSSRRVPRIIVQSWKVRSFLIGRYIKTPSDHKSKGIEITSRCKLPQKLIRKTVGAQEQSTQVNPTCSSG